MKKKRAREDVAKRDTVTSGGRQRTDQMVRKAAVRKVSNEVTKAG